MKVIKVDTYEEMSKLAAGMIADQIKEKADSLIGLATGSTPVGTYKELIRMNKDGELDFSKVKTANLDEYRGLTPDDPQSYRYFMNDNLFDHINIDKANTHVPDGSNPDSESACKEYDALIEKLGGLDLQLLGIGHDGHIGFNEPDKVFPKGTQCVDLQAPTIEANKRFFNSADEVPRQAYTMGIQTIMSAKKIVLVVNGADKAAIIEKTICGDIDPMVPASILQLHPDATIIGTADALPFIE